MKIRVFIYGLFVIFSTISSIAGQLEDKILETELFIEMHYTSKLAKETVKNTLEEIVKNKSLTNKEKIEKINKEILSSRKEALEKIESVLQDDFLPLLDKTSNLKVDDYEKVKFFIQGLDKIDVTKCPVNFQQAWKQMCIANREYLEVLLDHKRYMERPALDVMLEIAMRGAMGDFNAPMEARDIEQSLLKRNKKAQNDINESFKKLMSIWNQYEEK